MQPQLTDLHLEGTRARAESRGGAAMACVATAPVALAGQEMHATFAVGGQGKNALATRTLRHASSPLELGTARRPPFQIHFRVQISYEGRTSCS